MRHNGFVRGISDAFTNGYLSSGAEDVHVHTLACDDADQSAVQALADARARGLRLVCFTAHVRESTPGAHVDAYLDSIREAAEQFPDIDVRRSIETKIMNTDGDLDVPLDFDLDKLDAVHVSDHRFPLSVPLAPEAVADMLASGELSTADAWSALLDATRNAVARYPGSIVAHPLSIIPKVGLQVDDVPAGFGDALAVELLRNDAVMEINNKWSCPGIGLIREVHARGVPIVAASDAHHVGETGESAYLDQIRPRLGAG